VIADPTAKEGEREKCDLYSFAKAFGSTQGERGKWGSLAKKKELKNGTEGKKKGPARKLLRNNVPALAGGF